MESYGRQTDGQCVISTNSGVPPHLQKQVARPLHSPTSLALFNHILVSSYMNMAYIENALHEQWVLRHYKVSLKSLQALTIPKKRKKIYPIASCTVLSNSVQRLQRNVSANQRPGRPWLFSDQLEEHELGKGHCVLASSRVSSNSVTEK